MGSTPDHLWLAESLLNCVSIYYARDDDPADLVRFQGWLGEQSIIAAERGRPETALRLGATASAADFELAKQLQRELRVEAMTHHRGALPAYPTGLRAVADQLPLVVHLPLLVPVEQGTRGFLAEALAEVVLAGPDWHRMKVCVAEDCQWAYYDGSKNSSRRWCSMGLCGNRNKTRAYRQRQAASAAATAQ